MAEKKNDAIVETKKKDDYTIATATNVVIAQVTHDSIF